MYKTPEGYLVCVGVSIARTGEQIYARGEIPLECDESGKIIIHRDAKEVFRPETMASFEGKSFTVLHPEDFVKPSNWKELTKGIVQNVRRGGGGQENDLIADLLVTDADAIHLVESGLREVSCGYEAEYTQTGAGRGFQSRIIGNHLALVEQGRAGSAYAINDHIGKGSPMKMSEKIKAIFAKAQDEALKVAEEETKADPKKTKDEGAPAASEEKKGFVSMDDVKGYIDAAFEKHFGKKEEAEKSDDAIEQKPTESEPAEVKAKDEEVESPLEMRLKKVEEMLSKLMAGKSGDEASEEEESEESEDEEMCEDGMGEEEGMLVGDTASRIEILAPGLKANGKDAKAKAILYAYSTKDGKKVIDALTQGKAPDVKNARTVDTLFIAASELLKVERESSLSQTKTRDFEPALTPKGAMTAEKMNEINAKHYARPN